MKRSLSETAFNDKNIWNYQCSLFVGSHPIWPIHSSQLLHSFKVEISIVFHIWWLGTRPGVHCYDHQYKEESKQWKYRDSPSPKKFTVTNSKLKTSLQNWSQLYRHRAAFMCVAMFIRKVVFFPLLASAESQIFAFFFTETRWKMCMSCLRIVSEPVDGVFRLRNLNLVLLIAIQNAQVSRPNIVTFCLF